MYVHTFIHTYVVGMYVYYKCKLIFVFVLLKNIYTYVHGNIF